MPPGEDRLSELFRMQEELNDGIFTTQDIRDRKGQVLTTTEIRQAINEGQLGPNGLPNEWLRHYLEADIDENRELLEALLWKWWSKDVIDLQNIRVEIIDKLHFLLSLALVAGLSADELFRLYRQKYEVNRRRQEEGYSRETKTEGDNRGIT